MNNKRLNVIITGPESSGKSTLAFDLAFHFRTKFSGEYARTHLEKMGNDYSKEDVLEIAEMQFLLHQEVKTRNEPIAIFDTGLLVLKIWLQEKYHVEIPWIETELQVDDNDLYLLCSPEIPWEPDPLRENEHDRMRLFSIYFTELKKLGKDFIVVEGNPAERVERAKEAIAYKREVGQ